VKRPDSTAHQKRADTLVFVVYGARTSGSKCAEVAAVAELMNLPDDLIEPLKVGN